MSILYYIILFDGTIDIRALLFRFQLIWFNLMEVLEGCIGLPVKIFFNSQGSNIISLVKGLRHLSSWPIPCWLKIVQDITLTIPNDRVFTVTSPLNKCAFRNSNLCPYLYWRLSYSLFIQQLVSLLLLLLFKELLLFW